MTRLHAGRRTNLALLAVLATAFVTGLVAMSVGSRTGSAVVTAVHGAAGLALLLLVPWKSVVVRRRLRHGPARVDALLLAVTVVSSLVAGLVHSVAGPVAVGEVSVLDVHVGAAVVAAVVAALHVVRRPQPVRRVDLSRRTALRALALAGGSALAYGVVEGSTRALDLRGASRRSTGSYEVGSGDPRRMPITQWFLDDVPRIDVDSYVLTIVASGEVIARIAHADLVSQSTASVEAVLDCTGGWWSRQQWTGVRLDRLLPGPEVPGRSVEIVSATGFHRRLPRTAAASALLATSVGDAPLSPGHGAPVRLVVPGRRGFWWVKWVDRVEVSDAPWWWQPPLPLR
jgi:DMSO/TMAO reductase YedYZ molybdopterin-dependent catalytic subunit